MSWPITLTAAELIVLIVIFLAIIAAFTIASLRFSTISKKSVAQLSESEKRYRKIVETQNELIVRWGPGGIRTWANDAYCDYFKETREEIIGTNFFSYISDPEESRSFIAMLETLSSETSSDTRVHKIHRPDGTEGWLEWTNQFIFDENGALLESQSIGRDITDRKLSELALVKSETKYRNLVENTSEWVWQMDLKGNHTYTNSQSKSILGYEEKEFLDLALEELIHPEDLKVAKEQLLILIEQKQGWRNWQVRFLHRDGSYRNLDSSAAPLIDESGSIQGFIGIDRDITFRTLLAELSSDLLHENLGSSQIDNALHKLAAHFRVDAFDLWWLDGHRESISRIRSWRNPEIKTTPSSYQIGKLPWSKKLLLANKMASFSVSEPLPDEASFEQRIAESVGATAMVLTPLSIGDDQKFIGAGMAALYGSTRDWSEQEKTEMQLAFNLIATAETRFRAERELKAHEIYQLLLSDISTKLLVTSLENINDCIDYGLRVIARHYALDRVSLWTLDTNNGSAECIHEWAIDGKQVPISKFDPNVAIPWASEMIFCGDVLKLDTLDDIPPDRKADRAFFKTMGVKSELAVPLRAENQYIGAGVFSTLTHERTWPEKISSELRVFAEVLISAYARTESMNAVQLQERSLARTETLAKIGSYSIIPNSDSWPPSGKTFFSEELCDLYDCIPEEASFDIFVSLIHPVDRTRVLNSIQKLLEKGVLLKNEYRIVRPNGEIVYVEDRTEILRTKEGNQISQIFGSLQNVTERVQRELDLKNALVQIENLKERLEEENMELRDEIKSVQGFDQIIGNSLPLKRCLDLASKVAATDATVLLLGETGTGKELIAHAIHDQSTRKNKRLISVNCAALQDTLVENELFGHEKGAFTGADSMQKGRFELADGGTLFLDEIGELPLSLQSKLLRVIQEGEFERLGGSTTLKVDVRLLAATNRHLKDSVGRGEFREDLYYRIGNFPIEIPSLRDRKEDIPLLAEYFVRKFAAELGKEITTISANLLHYINERSWPGNIRELEGFIQHQLITNEGNVLTLSLIEEKGSAFGAQRNSQPQSQHEMNTLSDNERNHIIEILNQTGWLISGDRGAAKILGVPVSTLRSRMERLGIKNPDKASGK